MSIFSHFLYDHDFKGNHDVKWTAFKPRRGSISMLLEDGLTIEGIRKVGDCVLDRLNRSRDEHQQSHATLEGRGQFHDHEIEKEGLSLKHTPEECFPTCHHWEVEEWPEEDLAIQQIASRLARIATGRLMK